MENIIANDYGIEIPKWYQPYVDEVNGRDILTVLKELAESTPSFLKTIQNEKWDYAYAPGKWTLKEVVIHMMDCERVFAFRALCFSRNDKTPLPAFDENSYAPNSKAGQRTPLSIIREYEAVKNATIEMFGNFDEEMLNRPGTANNFRFTAKLAGACIAGHEMHHIRVVNERYLI